MDHPAGPETLAKVTHALEAAPPKLMPVFRGRADGWLRVLRASDLLDLVNSERATEAMWRQSRLSSLVWRRDLLPALHRYADYVQLMPASESHHHAHVGGLLAHTLEMTLAAMTWRNGHFFPEGAPVEEMDAQRDEWTYVVFFGALLHDVGKIMADLRISWSCADMDAPIRWVPMSGPLTELVQKRPGGEYLVEFTPKSARDYQAHAKLAIVLLQQIAPPSALSFLARRPQAFDALVQYLSATDKTSQLAQIVRKADQASTQQALATGSRTRFATSRAVPLIDLLMQAIKDLLNSGTALPLNRSGAAGWVYEGSVWFVAKRLADGVRQHIVRNHPEEAIPGESKNDRLFDTWQEYGCIQLNPQTSQAVWYVQVHGEGQGRAGDAQEGGADEGGTAYTHALTMLRFPLDKVFASTNLYPPAMRGRIEILQKRASGPTEPTAESGHPPPNQEGDNAATDTSAPARAVRAPAHAATPEDQHASLQSAGAAKPSRARAEPTLKAPVFNKPKPASAKLAGATSGTAAKSPSTPASVKTAHATMTSPAATATPKIEATTTVPKTLPSAEVEAGQEKWLDFEDDAAVFKTPIAAATTVPSIPPAALAPAPAQAPGQVQAQAPAALPAMPKPLVQRPLLMRAGLPSSTARTTASQAPRMQHTPVIITPFLPELPHETASKQAEPTSSALSFINWLQQGMASRTLKYNEAGAMIHFTEEGMALVSPLVFKAYVAEKEAEDSEAEAQALQVQREVIKAGWHLMGPGKTNILRYQVLGRGNVAVGKLSAIVLIRPERWVMPVPPNNPVLKIA